MDDTEQAFRVMVRFRGLNAREPTAATLKQAGDQTFQLFTANETPTPSSTYTFDRVFYPTTTQQTLYDTAIRPLIDRFVGDGDRNDLTVLTYGQTGSGKTWTVDGNDDDPGLLPRSLEQVLANNDDTETSSITYAMYEIYCERLIDLLNANTAADTVQLYDCPSSQDLHMKNLTWCTASRADEVLSELRRARNRRHFAATRMNATSSRSHTVFDLRIGENGARYRVVDLAGSERASRTGAKGQTLTEANKINQSLMGLRRLLAQLSSATTPPTATAACSTLSRSNKLTRILYPSFRGKSRVLLLVCCSMAADSYNETVGSLQSARQAKRIRLRLDDLNPPAPPPSASSSTTPAADELVTELAELRELVRELMNERDECTVSLFRERARRRRYAEKVKEVRDELAVRQAQQAAELEALRALRETLLREF